METSPGANDQNPEAGSIDAAADLDLLDRASSLVDVDTVLDSGHGGTHPSSPP